MSKKSHAQKKPWWANGVRFQCQGSGKCCVSRGQYGFVYLTLKDRQRLAKHFGQTTSEFTRRHCKKDSGYFVLKDFTEACVFLKGKGCSVYESRPTQCRTWPFWPEVMAAKAWSKEVAAYCPGIGKGPVWTAEQIKANLEEQSQSEEKL